VLLIDIERDVVRSRLSVLEAPYQPTVYPRSRVPLSISQHKRYVEIRLLLHSLSMLHMVFIITTGTFLFFFFSLLLVVLLVPEQ
jgi:hypothetical protein